MPAGAPRPPADRQDLQATVPAKGWDHAQTLPASAPAPGSGPSTDETLPANLNLQQAPADDRHDLQATVPVEGWDQARTLPASAPTPGSAPSSDQTLPVNLNLQQSRLDAATMPATGTHGDAATLVDTQQAAAARAARGGSEAATSFPTSADAPTIPVTGGGTSPTGRATGSFSQTGSNTRMSGSFTRAGTRLGRTRINGKLQITDQQLDERLQLSRTSVLTDMAAARGAESVPKGLANLVEQQGTDARYHINRPLAAGGMGAVLDIQDNDFRRTAAMKVIHGKYAEDPQMLERFLAEAQVTAQLEHPNIVPIHDMGVMPDGSLYFTMKLIEGMSLGDLVKLRRIHAGLMTREQFFAEKEKKEAAKPAETRKTGDQIAAEYDADLAKGAELAARFTTEETLLTFLKVLDGVGFAHSRGVVHRDIKPDNIMLGAHGEVLVVDWGIAKVLKKADRDNEFVKKIEREVVSLRDADAISATMTGSAMGTLFYMPPEQARGDLDQIDGRSDIYALGATLYELLCLKRCLDVKSMAEALAAITTGDWIPLDRAAPELDKDLVAVVHRSMALDPARRYADCADFAEDIRRYLAGQAVQARKRNLIERLGAWYAAHKRQVQMGAAGVALVVVTAGGLTAWQSSRNAEAGAAKLAEADKRYREAVPTNDLKGFNEALNILGTAKAFSDDPRIADLELEISKALAAGEELQKQELRRQDDLRAARGLFEEAKKLKDDERYAEADAALVTALKKDAGNSDYVALRDEVQRLLSDKLQREREARAKQLRASGDEALAKAGKLDLADPQVVDLLDAAKQAYTSVEETKASPPGTQEKIASLAGLRLSAEAARNAKKAAEDAGPLKARAKKEAEAKDFVKARASLAEARGKTPGDKELDTLLSELSAAEARAADAAKLEESKKSRDFALERARNAVLAGEGVDCILNGLYLHIKLQIPNMLAAKKFDDALSQVDVALTHVPNDQGALDLRKSVLEQKAAAELEARRLKATTAADVALAQVGKAIQSIAGEAAKEADASAAVERLGRELGRAPVDKKGPLFAAVAEQKRARSAVAEQWALAEGTANGALAGLAEFPQDPKTAEVRKALCQLYLSRLRDARRQRSLPEINAFANLVRRYDPDGSFKRELDNFGRLTVSAPVTVRRLDEGPDTRLVPAGEAIQAGTAAVDLPAGSYQLKAGDLVISVVLGTGQDLAIAWPGNLPSIKGVPLACVPANGTQKAFLLGVTETTVAQYCDFLNSSDVLAEIAKVHRRKFEDDSLRGEPFPYVPGTVREKGYWIPEYVSPTGKRDDEGQLTGFVTKVPSEPMGKVSRDDAEAYCRWLSKGTGLKVRLPKAREWQFAAGGGDDRRTYPWGPFFVGQFTASALSAGKNQQAFAVRSFPADLGPFGHYDLAGNLREWLGDTEQDGALAAGASGALIAGGSFSSDNPLTFQTTYTESVEHEVTNPVIGFRVLVELP